MYIYICVQKEIVIERTRDLIYLKFVATDFSPKITVLVKTPVTLRSPCYSAVSALLTNPLPDRSNYSPLCHTHYLTPDQYFTSLFRPDPLPSCELETNNFKVHCCSALLQNLSREHSALRKLNNKQRQVSMFLSKLLTQFPFVSFLSISILLPFSILSLLPLPHPFFLL